MAKSKFEEKAPIVLGFLSEGHTLRDAADKAGIGQRTLFDWMEAMPQFSQQVHNARKEGEQKAVRDVEATLLNLAKGYEYEDVKTEYESRQDENGNYVPVIKKQTRIKKTVPANIEAIKFYLINKVPDEWKNRIDNNQTGNIVTDLKITHVSVNKDDSNFPSSEDEVDAERQGSWIDHGG